MKAKSEEPLDLSSNGNVVRHMQKVIDSAMRADELMSMTMENVETVRCMAIYDSVWGGSL